MANGYQNLELWEVKAENNYGIAEFMVWKSPTETLEDAFRQQYPAPTQPRIIEQRNISGRKH